MPIHCWTRVQTGIFHDFHHEWISTLKRALNSGRLPGNYYALAEQIAGGLGPDVLTLESAGDDARREEDDVDGDELERDPTTGDRGIALATARPNVRFTATAETERYARRRSRIVIRHATGDNVVAVVEIASPGNKSSRHALRSFLDKAVDLLEAGVHLLIIDLFAPGVRDPQGIHAAIWSEITEHDFQLPGDQPLTLAAYAAGDVSQAFIEAVAVGDVLPEMPLFLEPDRYVPVPLDESYQSAFDAVPERWQHELEPTA